MTKLISILMLIPFFGSCAKGHLYINKELLMYVEAIEEHIKEDLFQDDYSILFDTETNYELDKFQAGVCRLINNKPFQIIIDKARWDMFDTETRLALVAHEVLHCSFLLGHVKDPNNYNATLMSPYTSDSSQCVKNLGMVDCIEEAFQMFEDGQLLLIGSEDGHDHNNH